MRSGIMQLLEREFVCPQVAFRRALGQRLGDGALALLLALTIGFLILGRGEAQVGIEDALAEIVILEAAYAARAASLAD
ncbi:MAG: hypothetical protein WDN03_02160 [Rhizomicrobium sp.]